MNQNIKDFVKKVAIKNPGEVEFIQAVQEVAENIIPFIDKNEKYQNKMLLERMVEPERVLILEFLGLMIGEKQMLIEDIE